MNPKVTVLMSVFNGQEFLKEAIESILNQTFIDFEFLIIDDGSTDDSVKIIEEINDPRIKIVRNEKNLGLAASLNIGIKLAKGEYIARMDADDISMPERLEKQVKFMEENPEVGVLGTWFEGFPDRKVFQTLLRHEDIYAEMFQGCPIGHPTAIIRKSVFEDSDSFYDESFGKAQDYELWTRLIVKTRFANLPIVLLKYRFHGNQASFVSKKEQLANDIKVKTFLYSRFCQENYPELEKSIEKINNPSEMLNNVEVVSLLLNYKKTYSRIKNLPNINSHLFFRIHSSLVANALNRNPHPNFKLLMVLILSPFLKHFSLKIILGQIKRVLIYFVKN